MIMKREVAFRIKREAMGLSQKDIAEFAKVSGSTVSMYENGQLTKESTIKLLEDTMYSTIDRIYPYSTRDRYEFNVRLYERLWEVSETVNDKKRFLNQLLLSVGFIQKDDIQKERPNYSHSGNREYVFEG